MSEYFKGEEQSLQDILEARDMRVEFQEYLLNKYKMTIVSYKLNIPGPVKYSLLIKQIFDAGLEAFKQKLSEASIDIIFEKVWYKNSGPEYFAVFNIIPVKLKQLTTSIEENHALGRLYDFDVVKADGTQVSRQELGIGQRKCLLCENSAFECGRSRRHEVSALLAHIEATTAEYFKL
ncbi:citrate lyase holo-[acyl-carrier protein] synthase [Clostridium swellfunianum]|uniref:citrate lyase holo-[acyl-carrier protein] synthase n=1 Tax=Clostridium swellfunianum TaxID=1367462 RepID=UPI00202FC010|nr:citrate lyase holo-[acyl-carrier protein] synthase [Clostridium swellfunianum]